MKRLLSLFRQEPKPVRTSPPDQDAERRDQAYREAFKAIRDLSTQSGVQLPTEEWRLELLSEGIVDGWLTSSNYDPGISMDHIVHMSQAAGQDCTKRYKDIWDAACAELDGRMQRRNGTMAALAVGHDAAPFRTNLEGVNASLYGRGVGLGAAIGWPTHTIPLEKRRCAPAIRPAINKAIEQGRYARKEA